MSTPIDELTLSQLRCFVAVADLSSFAHAGRLLGITNSAVSKTIARMEAAYGLRLLHRSTHSVSLTEAGERLIEPARAVLSDVSAVDAVLRQAAVEHVVENVRVGAPLAFVRRCLAPLATDFKSQHPQIVMDLRASDKYVDLAEAGLDLTIRSGRLDGFPGHIQIPWFEFDWVACASPAYLERRGIPEQPDDLVQHDQLCFRNARTGMVESWRFGTDQALTCLRPALIFDDAESIAVAAASGSGVMWGPRWLVAEALEEGRLMEVLQDWKGAKMQMSILRRSQPLVTSGVRAVIDFLKRSKVFSPKTDS